MEHNSVFMSFCLCSQNKGLLLSRREGPPCWVLRFFFLIVVLILLSQRVNFFTSWLSHLKSKHWRKTNQLREDKKNSPRARSMARIVQIFLKIGSGTDIQRILTSLHVVRSFCRMFNLCKNSDYIVLNEHVHSSSYLFYFVAFFGNF